MPMSISADKRIGLGGASNLQGQRMVKCALHEGVQYFTNFYSGSRTTTDESTRSAIFSNSHAAY